MVTRQRRHVCLDETLCFFSELFVSGLYIVITRTLNQRICIGMKLFVQEARSILINNARLRPTSVSSQHGARGSLGETGA